MNELFNDIRDIVISWMVPHIERAARLGCTWHGDSNPDDLYWYYTGNSSRTTNCIGMWLCDNSEINIWTGVRENINLKIYYNTAISNDPIVYHNPDSEHEDFSENDIRDLYMKIKEYLDKNSSKNESTEPVISSSEESDEFTKNELLGDMYDIIYDWLEANVKIMYRVVREPSSFHWDSEYLTAYTTHGTIIGARLACGTDNVVKIWTDEYDNISIIVKALSKYCIRVQFITNSVDGYFTKEKMKELYNKIVEFYHGKEYDVERPIDCSKEDIIKMDYNKYMRPRTVYEFKPDNFVIGGLYAIVYKNICGDVIRDKGILMRVEPNEISFRTFCDQVEPFQFSVLGIESKDADRYEIIELVENPISFDEYEYNSLCAIIQEALEAREGISYLATDKEVFCRIRDKVKKLTVFPKEEENKE